MPSCCWWQGASQAYAAATRPSSLLSAQVGKHEPSPLLDGAAAYNISLVCLSGLAAATMDKSAQCLTCFAVGCAAFVDGQYVLCGSDDGSTTIWDFATATPTPAPHMALGHAPIHCMAWSSSFQAVAVCSFSHYAPIRVLGYAADQPQVVLNPPSAAALQQARRKVRRLGPLEASAVPGHCYCV
jgi:WD40 repeat protein